MRRSLAWSGSQLRGCDPMRRAAEVTGHFHAKTSDGAAFCHRRPFRRCPARRAERGGLVTVVDELNYVSSINSMAGSYYNRHLISVPVAPLHAPRHKEPQLRADSRRSTLVC